MKIRSITYFMDIPAADEKQAFDRASRFTQKARQTFEGLGYEVQTVRLATGSFAIAQKGGMEIEVWAAAMERKAMEAGFEYLSLGPAYPDQLADYEAIPGMIAETENAFFSGMMTYERGISLQAARACARVIVETGGLESSGFANLRFTAMANVPPGSPFFPSGYHGGGPAQFAIATQAADLVVEAFGEAETLEEGQRRLRQSLEEHGKMISTAADELARESGVRYGGIDFSPAPFPQDRLSIGTAFERMGVKAVGLHGSLAAAAILTDALERAEFQRAGFSGLLMPMLEDSTLARRAAQGTLGVKDLLVYSAVCGTGLDTIPIPGDTTEEQLIPLLLDVAALSQRLGKPLTARLMPVPGKKAGEETSFDFPFFVNSRILEVEAEPLTGLLAKAEKLEIWERKAKG
jgi:uncharacterized protein (UPF0210 family)